MKTSKQDIQQTISELHKRFFHNQEEQPTEISYQHELNNPYFKLIPEAFHVYNLVQKKLLYVSSNHKDVIGWSAEEILGREGNFLPSLVHPDHFKIHSNQILLTMFRQMSLHCLTHNVADIKFTVTLKYRKPDGEYSWIMNSTIVHDTKARIIPATIIVFLNNINHFKQDEAITFTTLKKNKEGKFEVVKAQRFYNFNKKESLTKKELSVLHLLKNNNSTEDIAQKLYLSKRTIYNHRNNLLKKMRVNNVHQLIALAETNGLM
ncbi:MAG: LuxR C-terminal-related transcriptional regulator [Bacteroidetes bacterium]|nr:LuxR C-terminal-related transcriptional regulator [Bacteroidota bacterium]